MSVESKYKNELISIIHRHLPSCTIYLFGSRATGKESPGSDVDLAVDTGKQVPYNIILKILIDIEETTIPVNVDLVDLQMAQKQLKLDIMREGIKWTN